MLHLSPLIDAYVLGVTALLGLVMGSFLACLAWRSMRGESVMHGRSHCDSCGHVLGPLDLVPVVSWVALRGRCRYCGERIPASCPITEAACAVAYVGIVWCYDVTPEALELIAFTSVLVVLTLTDLDERIIPNACIIVAVAIRLAYVAWTGATGGDWTGLLTSSLIGAAALGIPLLVLVLVMDHVLGRESMGGGDLKLLVVCGLYVGWQQGLLLLIIACVLGLVLALVPGLIPHDHADGTAGDTASESRVMGTAFPFGPAIAVATWVTMLVGSGAVAWYLGLF